MEIALLGGTGDFGEGLALRWARDTDHTIRIGSRDAGTAETSAAEYDSQLGEAGLNTDITGDSDEIVAESADVVVVSVPPEYAPDTVESVSAVLDEDAILVSPAVQMTRDADGFDYDPPAEGSVVEAIAAVAPGHVRVVGGFQNLPAGALCDFDNELDADVVITGDDSDTRALVREIAEGVNGIRAFDGDPLSNTGVVEGMTPLLINVVTNNDGMHDLGVRFQ